MNGSILQRYFRFFLGNWVNFTCWFFSRSRPCTSGSTAPARDSGPRRGPSTSSPRSQVVNMTTSTILTQKKKNNLIHICFPPSFLLLLGVAHSPRHFVFVEKLCQGRRKRCWKHLRFISIAAGEGGINQIGFQTCGDSNCHKSRIKSAFRRKYFYSKIIFARSKKKVLCN